jgi:hypothetical protein
MKKKQEGFIVIVIVTYQPGKANGQSEEAFIGNS